MTMKASAISGAMGIAGGVIDNAFQQESQRRQHEYEKENMALQNSYQLAQWNRENAYNSPQAVKQRYEMAGINPATALGQSSAAGAGLAGSFGSAPSASTSAQSVQSQFGLIGSEIMKNAAQASLFKAQANKVENETPTDNTESLANVNVAEKYSVIGLNNSIAQLNTSIQKLNTAKTDNTISDTALKNAMRANEESQTALNNFKVQFNKDNRDNMLRQAEWSWRSAEQAFAFNESKNPLVIKELEGNLRVQAMNLVTAEIANRLAESNINVNQAQINHFISKDNVLSAEYDKILAQIVTENEMRGYRKAESVMRTATGFIDSITRFGSAIATVGASEIAPDLDVPPGYSDGGFTTNYSR